MIVWKEKTVPLSQLKPYERNPRLITKEAYDRLKDAIKKLGFHQRMVCQPIDDKGFYPIIGGHQRLKALSELGFKDVQILVPDRALTTDEFRQLLIQDNLPFGQHDFSILAADFDMDELLEWGVPEKWLVGSEEKTPKETEDDSEKMVFTLTPEQMTILTKALLRSCEDGDFTDNSSALISICQKYLSENN